MTRDGYKKHKNIIDQWSAGAKIQYLNDSQIWTDTLSPNWYPDVEYRTKPVEKYIPFDFSDAERLIGKKIKSKDSSSVRLITFCGTENVSPSNYQMTYDRLLNDYEFLDGTPCGKKVNF